MRDADREVEVQHAPLRVIFVCVLVRSLESIIFPSVKTPNAPLYSKLVLELFVRNCRFVSFVEKQTFCARRRIAVSPH